VRISPQGGRFSPTFAYERFCPPGAHIVSIEGRSGDVVDAIGPLTCSDGTILPRVGGHNGNPFTTSTGVEGYSGINVHAGTLLDQLTFVPVKGPSVTFGGSRGDPKPSLHFPGQPSLPRPAFTAQASLHCPGQLPIAGIFGTSDVISVGLLCRSYCCQVGQIIQSDGMITHSVQSEA
jgi:hypothetical protein